MQMIFRLAFKALPYAIGSVAVAAYLNCTAVAPNAPVALAAAPPCQGMVLEERAACLKSIKDLKAGSIDAAAFITIFSAAM